MTQPLFDIMTLTRIGHIVLSWRTVILLHFNLTLKAWFANYLGVVKLI